MNDGTSGHLATDALALDLLAGVGPTVSGAPCRERSPRRLFGRRWRCEASAHAGRVHRATLPGGSAVLLFLADVSRPPVPVKGSARRR